MLESVQVSFKHEIDWGEFDPYNFQNFKKSSESICNVKIPVGKFTAKVTFSFEIKTDGRLLFNQKIPLYTNKDCDSSFRRLSLISISKQNHSGKFKIVKKKGKVSKRLEKLLQRRD